MRKKYEEPKAETVFIKVQDVIMASEQIESATEDSNGDSFTKESGWD